MIHSLSSQFVFDVNQSNKLLYQVMELKDVAGKFSLGEQGSACVSVQVSVQKKYQDILSIWILHQSTNQKLIDRLTDWSINQSNFICKAQVREYNVPQKVLQ